MRPKMLNKTKSMIKNYVLHIFDLAIMNTWLKRRQIDYERVAYIIAAEESARFFVSKMHMTPNLVTRYGLLGYAMDKVTIDGLWLEFGVYAGADIRKIAERAQVVYGFDSFEGLPEDWTHFQKKGRYSLDGKMPVDIPSNVKLIKGWFSDTLPSFLETNRQPISFLHIDSDLYSSAKYVCSQLQQQIVVGTVIVFDDFLNYPGWQYGEHKAFDEFIEQSAYEYEFLGFASSVTSAAIRITKT